jgi:hypothetical protein
LPLLLLADGTQLAVEINRPDDKSLGILLPQKSLKSIATRGRMQNEHRIRKNSMRRFLVILQPLLKTQLPIPTILLIWRGRFLSIYQDRVKRSLLDQPCLCVAPHAQTN